MGIFSYVSILSFVVSAQNNRLNETVLLSTQSRNKKLDS